MGTMIMIHSKRTQSYLQAGFLIGLSLLALSCDRVMAPDLQGKAMVQPTPPPPRVRPDKVVETAGQDLKINPKVDILFVIDNSQSMEQEQFRLAKNIRAFVDALEKNPLIDYHIGVVPVYDRGQYEIIQAQQEGDKYSYLQEADRFYDVKGYLQPLLHPSSFPENITQHKFSEKNYPKVMLETDHPPYVTKDLPDYRDVLEATLFIGVIPWRAHLVEPPVRIGPQKEELFSPVLEVLNPTKEITQKRNAGFRRRDAHFVAILITDADDADGEESSKISAGKLNAKLQEFTGSNTQGVVTSGQKQNYSVYGVIFPPTKPGQTDLDVCPGVDENDNPIYPRDHDQQQPIKIAALLRLARGLPESSNAEPWLSLCDPNYGEKLAAIGDEIRLKASDVEIPLRYFPERKEDGGHDIRVFFGDREVSPGEGGWKYSGAKRNSIVIKANFDTVCVDPVKTADGTTHCQAASVTDLDVSTVAEDQPLFRVEYTPVDLLAAEEGHTKKMFLK